MSGASKAIYELVTGLLSTKADDIIDSGPEELTDLAGQVFRSELPQLKDRTFETKEAMRKVEGNIQRSLTKKPKEPKEAFETNPMFKEVDETPKQRKMEEARVLQREEDYIDDRSTYVIFGDETDAERRKLDAFNTQMDNLTTFNDAYGSYIKDPLDVVRKDELISFYSTIDNTVDEIFKRTAKNRPGERGIRGRELLASFQRSNVKKSELKFIGFENRIKPDEFYTEANLKDIIDKSGIRVSANIKKDNIIDGVEGNTKYSSYQRQIEKTDDIYNVYFPRYSSANEPANRPVVPIEYFEITLDISPNFKSYINEPTAEMTEVLDKSDEYSRKFQYLEGNILQGERPPHFSNQVDRHGLTLAHMRGTIVEMASDPSYDRNLYDLTPIELKRRLIIEEFQSDVVNYLSPKYFKENDYTAPPLPFGNRAKYLRSKKEELSKFDRKDYVAFSKDKERSEKSFFSRPNEEVPIYGNHRFFQFEKEFKESRKLFHSASTQRDRETGRTAELFQKYYPKFAEDVMQPGTGTVLIKKGKNISNKRLERMQEEGVTSFKAKFYDHRGRISKRTTIKASEEKPSISLDNTTLELLEDPVAASQLKDGLISREDYIDASIEYTQSVKGEDYLGTIIKNPQEVDRKLPFSGDSGITDYVEKLLQAAIVHAKQNNIDEIVIPNADMMGAARNFKRGSAKGFVLMAKIYDKAVSKALKKIEAESKGKIKVSNEVIDKNDKQIKRYLGSEKPKIRQMAYEQSSKVLNISNLDLNVEQIMARFSRGGLVTSPSNGLMSR